MKLFVINFKFSMINNFHEIHIFVMKLFVTNFQFLNDFLKNIFTIYNY